MRTQRVQQVLLLLMVATSTAAMAQGSKVPIHPGLSPQFQWINTERIRGAWVGATDVMPFFKGSKDYPRRICFAQTLENAGFNFIAARMHFIKGAKGQPGDYKQIGRKVGYMFEGHDLRWIPLLGMTHALKRHVQAQLSHRLVNANGQTMDMPAPTDWEYWRIMFHDPMTYFAKLSRDQFPHMIGIGYDIENYGPCSFPPMEDYSDLTFNGYLASRKITLSGQALPAANQRKQWLDHHGHADDYLQYVRAVVTGYWKRIERDVHAINPDFMLSLFAVGYHPEYEKLVANHFGSQSKPILLFGEQTYNGGYMKHSRNIEQMAKTTASQFSGRAIHVPGLRNHVWEAEPMAWHMYQFATRGSGYWIWDVHTLYARMIGLGGSGVPGTYRTHLEWYQQANEEIVQRMEQGAMYQTKLIEPKNVPGLTRDALEKWLQTARRLGTPKTPVRQDQSPELISVHRLENMAHVIYLRSDELLAFELKSAASRQPTDMVYALYSVTDGQQVAYGGVPSGRGQSFVLRDLPEGYYMLVVSSTSQAECIIRNLSAVEIVEPLVIYQNVTTEQRRYFRVPAGTKTFTFAVRFNPGATGVVDILDGEGNIIEKVVRDPSKNIDKDNLVRDNVYGHNVYKDIVFTPNNRTLEVWSYQVHTTKGLVKIFIEGVAPFSASSPSTFVPFEK